MFQSQESPSTLKLIFYRCFIDLIDLSLFFSMEKPKTSQKLKMNRFSFKLTRLMEISIVFYAIHFLISLRKANKLKNTNSIRIIFDKQISKEQSHQFKSILLYNRFIICDGFGCENENIEHGRSYENDNILISHCFFSRSSVYSGEGGVIYVFGGLAYSMRMDYTMLYNCACSSNGGAIFFYSNSSYMGMICANSCSCGAQDSGHFAYIVCINGNEVEYLSVSNCWNNSYGFGPICLNSGNIRVDNMNSSMNQACQISGISVSYPSAFSSSHCTFSNNKVMEAICLAFFSFSGILPISYANIVNNNSPLEYGVVTCKSTGSRKMMFCIYQNNSNYLFFVYHGSLEVSHSFIDHSLSSFSSSIAVSTETNNSFSYILTYQIQYYQSHHCNADIPLPQRTIDQSPMKSFQETASRTNQDTLMMTLERTIVRTIRESPIKTIPRTYSEIFCTNQLVNYMEISFIFSFLYLAYFQ